MEHKLDSRARAVYDVAQRRLLASVELPANPERVFEALVGPEVTSWWVNPGVFDTREWRSDLTTGGRWQASGMGRGKPYGLEGEFLEIAAPRKLVHSWGAVGGGAPESTVTYLLDPVPGGTHLTLRHEGFSDPNTCIRTCLGWETSLEALVRLLGE